MVGLLVDGKMFLIEDVSNRRQSFRLEQWFSIGSDFASQGTFGNIWRHISEGVLLASSGWRPGMLLNILQCTAKSHPVQNVSSIPLEKLWVRDN